MLPQERQKEILALLQEYRSMKINELSKQLNVTRETIRKDLYEMEDKGLIKKVHGGAILNKANSETDYGNRKYTNYMEKRSIARKAAELVEDGDTIYIDYGTTALLFAKELIGKNNLTVITNSLPIANELVNNTDFEVVVIGGTIRKNEKSLFGPVSNLGLEHLYVDSGFFGMGAISSEAGYTNFHMGESEVSRRMIQHSSKTVVIADFSKFNSVAMNKVASIDDVDVLVTDENTDQEALKNLETQKTSIVVVEVDREEQSDE